MSTSAVTGVNSATAYSPTGTTTAAAATNQLSYDDFLTLLMSELQHQDPTQPMDPTQMVSQLATVSTVGQQVQTNQNLTALLTANSLTQAEGMIGHTITSADGKTTGVVGSVTLSSTGAVANLTDGSQITLSNGVTIQ
jgi:flagellar basal-body rod modification protein FlgD